MQGLAGEVEKEHRLVAEQPAAQCQIRLDRAHARAAAAALADLVDDRILDALRRELGMLDLRPRAIDSDREGLLRAEVFGPVDRAHAGVKGIRVRRGELGQWQQHTAGDPRPEADAIGVGQAAGERDPGAGLDRAVDAKASQLVGEQAFEMARGAGEEACCSSWS